MAEILITLSEQGNTVEVQRSDVIVIRLEENLTTGYSWEIETTNHSIIGLVESDYSQNPETRLGIGGVRTFRFRAQSSGQEIIQLRLKRPWDSADSAVEHFDVTVQVK
jgi:inhibitor of cysteine peptidase